MRTARRRTRSLAIALVTLAAVGALAAAVAGLVLADIYRPVAAASWTDVAALDAEVRRSESVSSLHLGATVLYLGATVAATVLVARVVTQRDGPAVRRAVVFVALAAATATAVLTLLSRALVEWDQLALWTVTVGTDISGYWSAAFDDIVRFVLFFDNMEPSHSPQPGQWVIGRPREVSPDQYRTALFVHLGAPVAGAVALAVVLWSLRAPPELKAA